LTKLVTQLKKSVAVNISESDHKILLNIIAKAKNHYRQTIPSLTKDLDPIFKAVPKRRERRQHIGLLSYGRKMGKSPLPRAISFIAGLYSLGIPPEFLGFRRTLESLTTEEIDVLNRYYINLRRDIETAGQYINRQNLASLALNNKAWKQVENDINLIEKILGIKIGPCSQSDLIHENLTTSLLLQKKDCASVARLIVKTGKIRKSLA